MAFAQLGTAESKISRIRLDDRDKYNIETTRYLQNVNNAIYSVSQNMTAPTIYEMILEALKTLKEYKNYIPCIADIGTVLYSTTNGLQDMWALHSMYFKLFNLYYVFNMID